MTSSSRQWSGEVDYNDFWPILLIQRRCHIRCVANEMLKRGGNGAKRTSNEYEASYCSDGYHGVAAIDDGALLHQSTVTADRQY